MIGQAKAKIKAIDTLDGFYDKVMEIVGDRFWQDWEIDELQRVADNRYEELGGK